MTCPPDVAEILLEIINRGILRARAAGWSNDAGRCGLEADHIHNLPALVQNWLPDLLRYYWEAEKPSFVQRAEAAKISVQEFEPLWQKLRPHAENLAEPVLAK